MTQEFLDYLDSGAQEMYFVEYSPSQKWVHFFHEDDTKYLKNPRDFQLLFHGTWQECFHLAPLIREYYGISES